MVAQNKKEATESIEKVKKEALEFIKEITKNQELRIGKSFDKIEALEKRTRELEDKTTKLIATWSLCAGVAVFIA